VEEVKDELLVDLDDEVRAAVKCDETPLPQALIEEKGVDDALDLTELKKMTVPQRIKLALFGNRSTRNFLLRDSSRLVQLAVLSNPRLSEEEVVEFARNTQVDDAVIRKIAASSTWLRVYAVKHAIVTNPKTPLDISLNMLKLLHNRDIQRISKSKNLPQVLATHAIKLIEKRR
jgi:hypothetical protein